MVIDPHNRVTGTASSIFTFDVVAPYFFSAAGILRWPASTAATVAPVKLLNKFSIMANASPDGSQVLYDMNKVLDTHTGKLLSHGLAGSNPESAINSTLPCVFSVNNRGWATGHCPTQMVNGTATAIRAAIWRAGAGAGAGAPRASGLGPLGPGRHALLPLPWPAHLHARLQRQQRARGVCRPQPDGLAERAQCLGHVGGAPAGAQQLRAGNL